MKKLFILCMVMALMGCHDKSSKTHTTSYIVVAQSQVPIKHLYFSGTIQPLKTVSIFSPVDGRIQSLSYVYGQKVKKGTQLAVINSLKLMEDFRQAVTSYLSKKASYLNQSQMFSGTKVLYKAGVIDKQEYQNERNQYENSVIDFFQQQYQLQKVLAVADVKPELIQKLKISDTNKVKNLFAKQFNYIKLKAPTMGVALFPLPQVSSAGTDDGSDSGKITVGSKVREGQLLLSIGDLSGLSIDMDVSEVNINNIHQGMHAYVTGDAFPGIKLVGRVSYVASQAQPNNSSSNSSSMFRARVTVPQVLAAQLKMVHVGMTAKVDIEVFDQPRVLLPIDAVFKKGMQSFVTIVDADSSKRDIAVKTGDTTPTEVVILSGITSGQKVLVHDSV